MKKLYIHYLDEIAADKHVAIVTLSNEKGLEVKSEDPQLEKSFQDLINKIVDEHPELPLRSATKTVAQGGAVTFTHFENMIPKENENYLDALADYITRSAGRFVERKFGAFIED